MSFLVQRLLELAYGRARLGMAVGWTCHSSCGDTFSRWCEFELEVSELGDLP